jgi:Ser/Thr protein kinase RdoA (MazF antagonist)
MMRDAALAAQIAAHHGLPTGSVVLPQWPGVVNHVFVVGADADRYVVRFPRDAAREDEFEVEEWCIRRATAAGIPSAECVARGALEGVPYLVQRFAAGVTGELRRSDQLWRSLGEYAREISRFDLTDAPAGLFSRFGRDLPEAWARHLDYSRAELSPTDPLIGLGVYSAEELPRLRGMIDQLAEARLVSSLSHGDLALRNLLVDAEHSPVLIDWGAASTGPVPHTDLLNLLRNHEAQDNPRTTEIAAFAEGYGIVLDEVMPQVRAMQLLVAVDLVRWARDRRPDQLAATVSAARRGLAAATWSQ